MNTKSVQAYTCEHSIMMYLYTSDLKLNSRRATALHSLASTHNLCKDVSSNPDGLDQLNGSGSGVFD